MKLVVEKVGSPENGGHSEGRQARSGDKQPGTGSSSAFTEQGHCENCPRERAGGPALIGSVFWNFSLGKTIYPHQKDKGYP